MSGLRRIISNTLISLFGQFVTWTSTLILTIGYGRFLGDVRLGELFLAITFVALVGTPIGDGFNQQLTRDIAEDPEKSHAYLWNTLLIKTTLWVLLYGLILFLGWALGYDQEQWSLIAICGITLLSSSIIGTFASVHYAFERTLFPTVGMILEKGLSACVGFILLKMGASVQTMAFVLLGGSVIDAVWVAWWFFRLTGWHVVIQKAVIRKLLRTSIPFLVYAVLGVIYYRIDTVLLSLMDNAAVVGWYGAGYRLFDTLLFIPNLILGVVMYPVFSKLSSVESQSTLKMAVEKCMNLILICALPIATLLIFAAPNIIGFLYHSKDFDNTIPVLQALAPGLIFLYINTVLFSVIVSTKGEKRIPLMAGAALVFNLSLNLFLIPRYQQVGAAVVTSLTELLLLCISVVLMPKHLLPRGSFKVGVKTLIAALFMALATFLLKTSSILLISPIVFLVYAGVATLLRTIPREDVQILYRAVRDKGKRTSTETLADMMDENMYTQITERLPAVRLKKIQSRVGVQLEEEVDDEITERLPAVRPRRTQSKAGVQLEEEVDDEITERLPAVRVRKIQ
jgi:O-antigen/teichoic acid export membrane protein